QRVKAAADISVLEDALVLFHSDTGRYPHTLDELVRRGAEGWAGPYVRGGSSAFRDPWGNEYRYEYTGSEPCPCEIGSYGADGGAGGEGASADIFPERE
ncbi:type II secretion system protein GspG, partial [Planctomycetota bacterium]